MTDARPKDNKKAALLVCLGLFAIGAFAFWQSGRVDLIVTTENAPLYELNGKITSKSEDKDKVVARLKKGQQITSTWYYIGKDTLLYRVTHDGVEGYVSILHVKEDK